MRRFYDEEFKLNAIALSKTTGKNDFELEKKQKNTYSGKINLKDKEIIELKKKIKDIELEREILKKAIAIFSGAKE